MPNSFRIKTTLGIDKVVQVKLEQNYDTLEILSMSIQPEEAYIRNCAPFGVVCGRVFCNNGFGLPNARLSIFIPLEEQDEQNAIVTSLYPYKDFTTVNEDGYKYNLLPYSPSYSAHVPVGTFPDRIDALTNKSVIEVYDKYYKYTVKTNDAGDFMIFGVPVGQHTLFMQIDLSDIGQFSLTPQDLIRMGIATESQVDGSKFKFSENYSELPQIVTINRTIQVAPFFGEPEVCNYSLTRTDFDLTSTSRIKLQPTAVFMGSLISTDDRKKVGRKRGGKCKVKSKAGQLCTLTTGPGQIQAIRQSVYTDNNGIPLLEEVNFDNDGKVIDGDGTWVLEVPMNLNYVYTDELGNQKISNNPDIGVPTKGKYRFKVKWQQSPQLSEQTKRAYFLVPNVKERGWSSSNQDPITFNSTNVTLTGQPTPNTNEQTLTLLVNNVQYYRLTDRINANGLTITDPNGNPYTSLIFRESGSYTFSYTKDDTNSISELKFDLMSEPLFLFESSYSFSLDWNEYANPTEAQNCEDSFYEMDYNKVYTVSQLIDRYQSTRYAWNTIGIKRITEETCEGTTNAFPVNDAYYRVDFLFIVISFFLEIFKFAFIFILSLIHVLAYLLNTLYTPFIIGLIIFFVAQSVQHFAAAAAAVALFPTGIILAGVHAVIGVAFLATSILLYFYRDEGRELGKKLLNIKLPLVLYTDDGCERCNCAVQEGGISQENSAPDAAALYPVVDDPQTSLLIDSTATYNYPNLSTDPTTFNNAIYCWTGFNYGEGVGRGTYQVPVSAGGSNTQFAGWFTERFPTSNVDDQSLYNLFFTQLPPSELYNNFNLKAKYFDGNYNNVGGPDSSNIWDYGNGGAFNPIPGVNQIRTKWFPQENSGLGHYDNVFVMIYDKNVAAPTAGQIICFQDPELSGDINAGVATGSTVFPGFQDIMVGPLLENHRVKNVTYVDPKGDIQTEPYIIPEYFVTANTENNVTKNFKMDIEYFQVLTAMTLSDFGKIHTSPISNQAGLNHSFTLGYRYLQYTDFNPNNNEVIYFAQQGLNYKYYGINPSSQLLSASEIKYSGSKRLKEIIKDYDKYKVVICVRGVDVFSPSFEQEYDLSKVFGNVNFSQVKIRGTYKPNIPIQGGLKCSQHYGVNNAGTVITSNNNSDNFFNSYFFEYGGNIQQGPINYVTTGKTMLPTYYSALDESNFDWAGGTVRDVNANNYGLLYQYYDTEDATTNNWSLQSEASGLANEFGPIALNFKTDANVTGSRPGGILIGYSLGIKSLNNYDLQSDSSYFTNNVNAMSLYFKGEGSTGINGDYFRAFDLVPNDYESNEFGISYQNILGYWRNEIVEGGAFYRLNFYGDDVFDGLAGFKGFWTDASNPLNTNDARLRGTPMYYSPTYYKKTIQAPLAGMNNNEYTPYLNLNNRLKMVFRSDRLPSSTTESKAGPNSFLLHQNPAFAIFYVSDTGGAQQFMNVTNNPTVNLENTEEFIGASSPLANVINSLSVCSDAVPLGCYEIDNDGNPAIKANCDDIADPSGTELFFTRGTGCYNLVSIPIKTLRKDYKYTVEWITRLKLNLALCFDVVSHYFSNQWINGTLFAYAFQNNRIFDLNNEPFSQYCTDTIYLHKPTNTFYYRSSPYDSNGYFIGKNNVKGIDTQTGNKKLLGTPTTIMDLGPKYEFIQELVYNDEYDGYIVSKLRTTSFEEITDILNMFVLSRLINTSFINQLIPASDDPNEGQADPSVKALFSNTRWREDGVSIVPGFIDGDYSQMISINSEFGIEGFSSESYNGDSVFFGSQEEFPFFGLFITGNTQDRDYITPRRTIWNQNANINPNVSDFTNIGNKSQVVPMYQWQIEGLNQTAPSTIFGSQSNNWYTEELDGASFHSNRYQYLDRINQSSRYFKPEGSNSYYYRATMINFDSNGVPTETLPSGFVNEITHSTPYHFYFGLKKGSSALNKFFTKYVDPNIILE